MPRVFRVMKKDSPSSFVRAAEIKLMSARLLSDAEGNRIFAQLEPVLKDAMYVAEHEPEKIDATTVVMALGLLAFGYEFQGRWQDAVNHYTTALQFDPDNDGLLAARGMILYGSHNQAIKDLERAVQLDSPLIWPYAMLAHHALNTHRYKECIRLCEQALGSVTEILTFPRPRSLFLQQTLDTCRCFTESSLLGLPTQMAKTCFGHIDRSKMTRNQLLPLDLHHR